MWRTNQQLGLGIEILLRKAGHTLSVAETYEDALGLIKESTARGGGLG